MEIVSPPIDDSQCIEANHNISETLDGPEDTADFESDANVCVAEAKTNGEPTKSCISLPPLEIPDCDKDEDDQFSPRFVPATPTLLIPSLRGKLIVDGDLHICRGVWAMSDEAHSQPGQTSDFEFKLVKPSEIGRSFPKNGKYQGWFILKQPPPLKSTVKIDEKDMNIRFVVNDEGRYSIDGEGSNKFGNFTLKGTLESDGMLQMYRVYLTRPMSTKKRTVPTPTAVPDKVVKKSEKVPIEAVPTPRESSGRMRKKPNLGSGFEDNPQPVASSPRIQPLQSARPIPAPVSSPRAVQAPTAVSSLPVQITSGRAQRLSLGMQKCGDLLKELVKHPHAVWFLEPVDHIKLNIPDYPTIIAVPMDFRTIKQNLEANIYTNPDAFADHVRLVFRNATTYNHLRDNPVHIAAKEMSSRFEEKYRLMMAQLSASTSVALEVKIKPAGAGSISGPGRKPGSGVTPKTQTRPANFGAVAKGRPVAVPGPRVAETYLPAAIDSSAHHLAEMQRQMMEMQNEILKLKTEVRQKEIQAQVASQREAAHNPLTYEEKKALIQEIQQLPGAKMEKVVEMIKSAMPTENKDDGDEIEIPLDELDTLTLRKLQAFVSENGEKSKKRPSFSRQNSNLDEHIEESSTKKVKKERSPRGSKPGKNGTVIGSTAAFPAPVSLIPFPANEREEGDHAVDPADLLFSCDSFEDMHGEREDDDGEGEAGSEMSGQANTGTEASLENIDAWTKGAGSGVSRESPRAGTVTSLWGEAASQMQATEIREAQRKAEAAKLQSVMKAKSEPAKSSFVTGPSRMADESRAFNEDNTTSLEKRRHEEIRRLANLQRTVNLDSHQDEEMMELLR